MKRRTVTEYRVVCARYGQSGHGQHHTEKKSLKAAEQAVEDFKKDVARLPDRTPSHFYHLENPKRIQVRTVTPWEFCDE